MSKSKYGDSNLYMTTREFADLVIEALHEQNYFKKDDPAHPGDIVIAFTSTAESIASALEWAIRAEYQAKKDQEHKQAIMQTSNLSKKTHYTHSSSSNITYSPNTVLPQDSEIAPVGDGEIGYFERKNNNTGYL